MPFCVGLTGGIGSGKSSAARIFGSLGAGVVDVDDISHALTRPGGAAIAEIRAQFGNDAIAPDGSMDRARMRKRVFADASAKSRLEAILHPLIGMEARAQTARALQPYVMLVVPLLLERNAYRDVTHRVAVVDCPEQVQIERTMRRSAITENAVRAIMAAQLPRAERLANADDVIDNNGDEMHLHQQVTALHARYLDHAHRARDGGAGPAAKNHR
ncbi:MAG TPA: dephospho-CoA kinase [Burkholderiales bacterium]|nr:dephospho-CoA kinase [Burkholderiales bacterium]